MEDKRLFCFGLGYSATRLAQSLDRAEWSIAGTCRAAEQAESLRGQGIDAHVFDGTDAGDAALAASLSRATHVLSSVPPRAGDEPVLRCFGEALAKRGDLQWIGYLSTTGVYGNTDGAWVDETASVAANVPRSKDRAEAERGWLELFEAHGLPVHIFRLAGIYGPGRNPLTRIRKGAARRIEKPGHRFSRIHVDDIAGVLHASVAKPNPGAVYNVCDDEPEEPRVVTEFGCELLGADLPPLVPFAEAAKEMSPMGLTFWEDNRRVRNDRIKEELGVRLIYPTYREGLRALAGDDA